MSEQRGPKSPWNIVHNAFALYRLYSSGYLLALITVPYLVRVLGAADWGLVAFTQAFGNYLLLIVEFGFTLSATRAVSRNRNSRDDRASILAGVLGAKSLLGIFCLVAALVAQQCVPAFRQERLLFWSGVCWALAQGFSLMWYFTGLEKMRLAVSLDVAVKTGAVAGMLLLVRSPRDDWKVLALQAAASLLSFLMMLVLAYREVPVRLPGPKLAWRTLRENSATFIPRNVLFLNNVGNTFVLGLFCPPEIVGYYAGADRIGRAIIGLLGPVNDAFYPRVSHIARNSKLAILNLARVGLTLMAVVGVLMSAGIFLCAPHLVRLLLGRSFAPAIPLLRILAVLAPVIAINNVLGMQWMLPLDLDRPFSRVILIAAISNLGLALAVSPRWAATGVAWASVLSQVLALLGMLLILCRLRLNPLGRAAGLKARFASDDTDAAQLVTWAKLKASGRAPQWLAAADTASWEQP